jgi:hypothetical protein
MKVQKVKYASVARLRQKVAPFLFHKRNRENRASVAPTEGRSHIKSLGTVQG